MVEVALLLNPLQNVCQPYIKVAVLQSRNSGSLIWFAKKLARKPPKLWKCHWESGWKFTCIIILCFSCYVMSNFLWINLKVYFVPWTVKSPTPGLVMDREAWHAAVHGVTKCQTWLSNWITTRRMSHSISTVLESDSCGLCHNYKPKAMPQRQILVSVAGRHTFVSYSEHGNMNLPMYVCRSM